MQVDRNYMIKTLKNWGVKTVYNGDMETPRFVELPALTDSKLMEMFQGMLRKKTGGCV